MDISNEFIYIIYFIGIISFIIFIRFLGQWKPKFTNKLLLWGSGLILTGIILYLTKEFFLGRIIDKSSLLVLTPVLVLFIIFLIHIFTKKDIKILISITLIIYIIISIIYNKSVINYNKDYKIVINQLKILNDDLSKEIKSNLGNYYPDIVLYGDLDSLYKKCEKLEVNCNVILDLKVYQNIETSFTDYQTANIKLMVLIQDLQSKLKYKLPLIYYRFF